jgi:broad specificity phosphatase PhoE
MSEIFLIRHGQASFGRENYDRLSPLGLRQARVLAEHFIGIERHFDGIYFGRLERQRATAEPLIDSYRQNALEAPPPVVIDAFDEYDSEAVWRSQTSRLLEEEPALSEEMAQVFSDRKTFQRLFARVMLRWVSGRFDQPGVPTWEEFAEGVRQGLGQIMAEQGKRKKLAVFTSGGPIAVAVQTALALSDRMTIELNWQIMNASVSRLKYNRQGVALAGFNDVTHLELQGSPDLLTYR